jgi:hypothetical protein
MGAEAPIQAIKALTPEEQTHAALVVAEGEKAAAVVAETPGASPERVDQARAAGASIADRLLRMTIDDSVLTHSRAVERAQSAAYHRERAADPTLTAEARAKVAREAVLVQAESDNMAGVRDPGVRPQGYNPISAEELEASKARVESVNRS